MIILFERKQFYPTYSQRISTISLEIAVLSLVLSSLAFVDIKGLRAIQHKPIPKRPITKFYQFKGKFLVLSIFLMKESLDL